MSTRLVTFTVGPRLYGVDVSLVQEVLVALPRTRVPRAPQALAGLVNLRGQVVTVVDLRARLGLPAADPASDLAGNDQQPGTSMLVVLRLPGEPTALLVDAIGSVVDVEPGEEQPPPETLRGEGRSLVEAVHPLADRLLLRLDVARAVTL